MIRDAKKIISILQLKFLTRFAQALFISIPESNSSKNLYTLEGIWGIIVGQFTKSRPKYPIYRKGHIKVMKSLQLNISHPKMPYSSCFKVIWGSSLIQYLGHWENLGSLDPNTSNQSKRVIHRKPLQVFNWTFDAKWDKCRTILTCYTCFSVFGNWVKKVKEKKIKGMDAQRFIHSVKLHILHWMKPYSRVKTNWELSDTCISIFGELGQVRKIRPKCSKSWASTQKVIHPNR